MTTMNKIQILVLGGIFLLFVIVLYQKGSVAQALSYHDFADQRKFFSIPNFWNVISNLPMLFLGLYGFKIASRGYRLPLDPTVGWIALTFAAGIFLTSFGSSWYHWHPDNQSLIWDRLPMTLMFMPVFSLLIYEFIGKDWGRPAFLLSVPLGVFSIFYWEYTESVGEGDLRLYAFVQFFPMLAGPVIVLLSAGGKRYISCFWLALIWYIAAKVFEHFDKPVYQWLGFWSGHTLKHFISAVSLYYLLKLMNAWITDLSPPGRSVPEMA